MLRKVTWIYALLIPISFLTIGVGFELGRFVLFPEKYREQIPMCGVIDKKEKIYLQDVDSSGNAVKGQILFETNCASCHAVHSIVIGPALAGIEKRQPREWLYSYINNPAKVMSSGDGYAILLAEEYKKPESCLHFRV